MRIAIVCPGDGWPGGFRSRYCTLLRVLEQDYEVSLLQMFTETRYQELATDVARMSTQRVAGWGAITSLKRRDRADRVARTLLNPLFPATWERKLDTALGRIGPDVVFVWTFGYPSVAQYISTKYRTVLFAEETWGEIDRAISLHRRGSRVLAAVFKQVRRRSLRKLARAVVISPTQVGWAAASFPCGVSIVPHSVDLNYWSSDPPGREEGSSRSIFVIGDFSVKFKAEGLYDIVRATAWRLAERNWPKYIVASQYPLHPMLSELPGGIFQSVGAVADPRPYYAESCATLVPSFLVTGSKTTILQGWASNCPVVTTVQAAKSVGASNGVELIAGHDLAGVVEGVVAVVNSRELRERLRQNGLEAVKARHGEAALREALQRLFVAISAEDWARGG